MATHDTTDSTAGGQFSYISVCVEANSWREWKQGQALSESAMSDPKPARRLPPGMMRLAGAGVELAAGLGGACLLGWWIDHHFGTRPWGLLVCAIVGVVGGLYNLIRRSVLEMMEPPRDKKDREDGGGDGTASQ